MNREDAIAEKLSENFEKLRSSLENLKSMLEDLALAVPAVPDTRKLAASVLAALPEPEPLPPPAEEEPPAPPPAPAPAAAPPLNNALLFRAASIEFAKSQTEILEQLLTGLQEFAQRGILFIVRGDGAQAWNAFGFGRDMKQVKVGMRDDPILETMMSSRARVLLDGTVPAFIPDPASPRRSLLSPLLLKGKVSAFLYADSGTDGRLDHYSIDVLLRVASLVIDIFPLRAKREPLPPVLENQGIILPGYAEPAFQSEKAEGVLFEDTGTLASSAEEDADALPANQTIAADIPPEVRAYAPPRPLAAVPEPEAEPEIEEAHVVEEVHLPPVAPPPAAPKAPAIPPGEEKFHEDAQRFARLLVQEIVLYHPKEVEQGKRDRSLYALLKDDIDRSREAYEHRFQRPSVRACAYFDKALVKYLAEGDEALLGM
jgi:hypothetical protein